MSNEFGQSNKNLFGPTSAEIQKKIKQLNVKYNGN